MKKIYTENGIIKIDNIDRSPATDDFVIFETYLKAIKVSDFNSLTKHQKEKIFREYQCFCAYMKVNYESPRNYGLRGLFG